ncbi:acyl-CoA N-acyltransferase [Hyaloraphidium curvatum]|nr:acyl-CoA N-acyltransferase [Hyaloraphidium curvatum]
MLRAYRPGDGEALRESIVSSYEHLRPWIPWATQELTPREAEAKVRKWCAEYLENTAFRVGIWVEGRHVGGTGFLLRGKDISEGNGEIGMWLAAEQSGKGFGTIVLEMVLRWGFSDEWPCWQRLFWCTDAKNVGSARVAEKGGMKNEGTHRGEVLDVEGKRADLMVFALLREEWVERSRA